MPDQELKDIKNEIAGLSLRLDAISKHLSAIERALGHAANAPSVQSSLAKIAEQLEKANKRLAKP